MAVTLARRNEELESSLVRDLLAVGDRPGMRSLAGGLPDPAWFPVARLQAAVSRVLSDPTATTRALQYGPTDGLRELREQLTMTPAVQRVRGVAPDELVVTAGSQQALHLMASVLVDRGDEVVTDDPCYLGARQVLRAAGAQLVGIQLDAEGMRVDELADRLRGGLRPRLVYTVPAFHNPTGALLTRERGDALIHLAEHYGFLILEDDAYGALGFSGVEPPEPLANRAPDRVVTVGTVSKVLAPGLRVGWLRAPRELCAAITLTKQAVDLHTSSLSQAIVRDVFADAAFLEAHLVALRASYARRARVLAGAIGANPPQGGLFVWARFPGIDTSALLERAMPRGVMFVPGSAFAIEQTWREHARLSFATLAEADLLVAAHDLVALMQLLG
jgi:2-aminoadipate transaminase